MPTKPLARTTKARAVTSSPAVEPTTLLQPAQAAAADPAMAAISTFAFDLRQQVAIGASAETGIVVGRAEYAAADPAYLIRYKANDGRATEAWWNEDALVAA